MKTSNIPANLTSHLQAMHKGEEAIRCKIVECDFRSINKQEMKLHEKKIHPGEIEGLSIFIYSSWLAH